MAIRSIFLISLALAIASPAYAVDGVTVPVDVNIDTGSHTCTGQGQDYKVYKEIAAGNDRYFINDSLSVVSQFGEGNCVFSPDHGADGYVQKNFCVTDADGNPECSPRLNKVIVRAYADCTNDLSKIGTQVGTECRFTATSKRGTPQ